MGSKDTPLAVHRIEIDVFRVNRPQPHQPATAGLHVRSGERQSMPSINIDSCCEVSVTVPPASAATGHGKCRCSSRLVNRQRPDPSQNTILIRSARKRILLQRALHQHRKRRSQATALSSVTST